jgi:hypothetical protein
MDHAGEAGMKYIPIGSVLERFPQGGEARSALSAALAAFPRVGNVVRKKEKSHIAPDFVAQAREEGRAEAQAEYEALRKEDAERFASQLAAERQKWVDAESGKLAAQIEEGLRQIEHEIAGVTARLLKPVLADHAAKSAIDGLAAMLNQLLTQRPGVKFRISGPADLLDSLRERFANLAGAEFAVNESADIRVEADQAVIETALAPWTAKLVEGTA